jgi:hypothetical protein
MTSFPPARESQGDQRHDPAGLPPALEAMVSQLSPVARSELARRLHAGVTPAPSLPDERMRELGALSAILRLHGEVTRRIDPAISLKPLQEAADEHQRQELREHPPRFNLDPERNFRALNPYPEGEPEHDRFVPLPGSWRPRRARITGELPTQEWHAIEASRYDELRPDAAPSSSFLTRRYGSWQAACRAADGLLPDGRYTGISTPWSNRQHDRPRTGAYSREEVAQAIRACALALLTEPSCHQYLLWRSRRLRTARENGADPPRFPSHAVIMNRFGSYRAALAAAAISDEELASARATRAGLTAGMLASSPRARLAQLGAEAAAELGLDAVMLGSLLKKGFGDLPLPQAHALAHALAGSLDWLAERTPAIGDTPSCSASLDPDRIRHLRAHASLSDTRLREHIGLPIGPWRRRLNGSLTPTLAEASRLAEALGCRIEDLLAPDNEAGC